MAIRKAEKNKAEKKASKTMHRTMQVNYLDVWDTIDMGKRRIPIITVQGEQTGPTIFVVANGHGNEVTGIAVIHRLLEGLERHGLRRGTVHAMPLMNAMAAELNQRNMPADNENLNRCYPGNATGGVTDRLAHSIYTHIMDIRPNFVVDLHTTASRSIPYVILDRVTAQTAEGDDLARRLHELAQIFGITVVYDYPLAEYVRAKLDRSLPGALLNHGHIPAYTVELGPTSIIVDDFIDVGVNGINNLLRHWDMTWDRTNTVTEPWAHESRITTDMPIRRDATVCANETGWIEFLVRPGQAVVAGQPLANIRDILGRTVETVASPHSGHIIELVDRAVALPGTPLLDLAVPDHVVLHRTAPHESRDRHEEAASVPSSDSTMHTPVHASPVHASPVHASPVHASPVHASVVAEEHATWTDEHLVTTATMAHTAHDHDHDHSHDHDRTAPEGHHAS